MHVLDFVLPPETTGGSPVAILLHSAADLLCDKIGGIPMLDLAGPGQVRNPIQSTSSLKMKPLCPVNGCPAPVNGEQTFCLVPE